MEYTISAVNVTSVQSSALVQMDGCVGAIDFASYVKGHAGPDELSFDEVMPVNALRVAVLQQEHLLLRAFRPREQGWLAQTLILPPRL